MEILVEGRARVLGDDVNTDMIIRSQRKRETIDPDVLKQWLLETHSPDFAASVAEGDILVAGSNFGCGSAMEVAVTVPLAAGIKAVVARSFARAYFRNAINNGLIPVECEVDGIQEGDLLRVRVRPGSIEVRRPDGETLAAAPLPAVMLEVLEAGGLTAFVRDTGCLGRGESPG